MVWGKMISELGNSSILGCIGKTRSVFEVYRANWKDLQYSNYLIHSSSLSDICVGVEETLESSLFVAFVLGLCLRDTYFFELHVCLVILF